MIKTRWLCHFGLLNLSLLCWNIGPGAWAATTTVTVGSSSFSPKNVAIQRNDSVKWTWGNSGHSTTSGSPGAPSGLWNSGVRNVPYAFTNTFPNAGTFPYYCNVHDFTGSVIVSNAVNQLPSVTITNPPSGATFAAPWTGLIQANASDSDGSVTNVQFFSNLTLVGNDPTAPYAVTNNSVPVGSYTLTAVATDNMGATNTSSAVTVTVVTPVAIVLTAPQRLSATQFRFTHTANAGLSYVVQRTASLNTFTDLATNSATSNSVTFTDNAAMSDPNLYRVVRVPNP